MSSETRQSVEGLVALSPWVAFIVVAAWFWVLEVRDNARTSRVQERVRPGQSDSGSSAGRAHVPSGRWTRPLLRFDESAPDRVAGQLDAVAHAELFEDVRAVALDGLDADHQDPAISFELWPRR